MFQAHVPQYTHSYLFLYPYQLEDQQGKTDETESHYSSTSSLNSGTPEIGNTPIILPGSSDWHESVSTDISIYYIIDYKYIFEFPLVVQQLRLPVLQSSNLHVNVNSAAAGTPSTATTISSPAAVTTPLAGTGAGGGGGGATTTATGTATATPTSAANTTKATQQMQPQLQLQHQQSQQSTKSTTSTTSSQASTPNTPSLQQQQPPSLSFGNISKSFISGTI